MKKHPLISFFFLTYAITFGIAFLVSDTLPFAVPESLKPILMPLYRWGPALAAVIVVSGQEGRAGLKELFSRFSVRGVRWQWFGFIALFPLAIRLLSVGIARVFGESPPKFFYNQAGLSTSNLWLAAGLYFVGIFIQAGLAEEIGWRGYALPRLVGRFNALSASMILGLLWAVWHFHPINIEAFRGNFHWYALQTVCLSIIFTWVYQHTHQSILMAVLFHTFSNFADWVVPIAPTFSGSSHPLAVSIFRGLMLASALLLPIIFGKDLLRDSQSRQIRQEGIAI